MPIVTAEQHATMLHSAASGPDRLYTIAADPLRVAEVLGTGQRARYLPAATFGNVHGVVKMNIDTDTQYAFTRAVTGHMRAYYDGVLKVDGGVGRKKAYDPRTWGRAAEAAMAARVAAACEQLGSTGRRPLR